jgi:hypothetical protein
MIEFKAWPKIHRVLNETFVFTEKIDGTNACIVIDDYGLIGAQSRNRIITPESDNFGFAKWVQENKEDLLTLGPGHHFGEWWGKGIGRNYNKNERYFSLFNVNRWGTHNPLTPKCCLTVPHIFTIKSIENLYPQIEFWLNYLTQNGSFLAPNYMKPEGLVIFHELTQTYYKVILDK